MGEKAFRPFLLHGVTGSGKTEVYLRAVERALEAGKTALVLVPEIALTPHARARRRARFGDHGGGAAQRAVGGRAPRPVVAHPRGRGPGRRGRALGGLRARCRTLGLIVVDEEHEASYKQEDSPRYHGRDVAVMRARLERAAVRPGLGHALARVAPQRRARASTRCSVCPQRISARACPRSRSSTAGPCCKAGGDAILSPAAAGGARRAPRAQGADAAAPEPPRLRHEPRLPRVRAAVGAARTARSPSPSTPAGGSRSATTAAIAVAAPARCPSCGGAYLKLQGFGTERVVEAVLAALPDGAHRPHRSRPRGPAGRRGQDPAAPSKRARPTSWSAPR